MFISFLPCNNQCPAGEDIPRLAFLFRKAATTKKPGGHLTKRKPSSLPVWVVFVITLVKVHATEDAWMSPSALTPLNASLATMLSRTDTLLLNLRNFPARKFCCQFRSCQPSAAYQLALKGHDVTIKEGSPQAGGMMRYGIPKYRLPRHVLDKRNPKNS